MTIRSDHPLLVQTRAATTDPDAERRMIARIETVEAAVATALAETDPTLARIALPAAVVTTYVKYQNAIAESLIAGYAEIDRHHRALYARAVEIFGPEQRVVAAPPHEPLAPSGGRLGSLFR
jgi:hypothetical protein